MIHFDFKKTASLLLAGLMTFGLCACSTNTEITADPNGKKLSIVTTTFPEYDWVKQIAGANIDNIELTMLLDNGVDMHSFQPTAQDIVKISSCDIFIHVGGESDEWVEDALAEAVNQDIQVVNLMELLGGLAVEEEIVEGMQTEEGEEDGGEAEVEYDEHVWLSLRNAQIFVTGIADAMSKADPDNMERYQTNADTYNKALSELDSKYQEAVTNATRDTILFGDRFPFRYLLDDYNIKYYAAFAGCSAETEASFETIVFLSGKMDELGLKYVVVIDGSDQSIAQTIIDNTSAKNQEILVFDSMQSTKTSDGVTYVSIMSDNLEVFTKALG